MKTPKEYSIGDRVIITKDLCGLDKFEVGEVLTLLEYDSYDSTWWVGSDYDDEGKAWLYADQYEYQPYKQAIYIRVSHYDLVPTVFRVLENNGIMFRANNTATSPSDLVKSIEEYIVGGGKDLYYQVNLETAAISRVKRSSVKHIDIELGMA